MKRVGIASSILLVIGFAALAGNPTPSPPPDASESRRGLVNTGSQTLGGLKTFVDGGIIATLRTGTTFEGTVILTGFSDGGSPYAIQNSTNSETVSNLTLYVNPDGGNDSNSCIQSNLPCASTMGALSKVPKIIKHIVNIEHSAGVISQPGVLIENFEFYVSGYLVIRGAGYVPATLGAGPVSGSDATWVTGTNIWQNSVSVVSGGWATDALKGLFVCATAQDATACVNGARSCNCRPIVSNTSTTITYIGGMPVSPTGSPYEIRVPSTTLSQTSISGNPTGANSAFEIRNTIRRSVPASGPAGSGVSIADVNITGTSTTSTIFGVSNAALLIVGARFIVPPSFSGSVIGIQGGSSLFSSSGVFGNGFVVDCAGSAATCFGVGTSGSGYVLSVGASAFIRGAPALRIVGTGTLSGTGYSETQTTGTNVFEASGFFGRGLMSGRYICPPGSSGTGVLVGTTPSTPTADSMAFSGGGVYDIANCATGIRITGNSHWKLGSTSVFTDTATALRVDKGGRIEIGGTTITFNGTVTNEIQVDGTNYTLSAVDALSPQVTPVNAYGSWVGR